MDGRNMGASRQSELTRQFWRRPDWRAQLEFRLVAGGNEEKLFHRLVREGVEPSDIDLAILLAARTDKIRDATEISMQTRMFWGRKDRREFLQKKLQPGTEARMLFNELVEKHKIPNDAQLARLRAAAGTRWRRSTTRPDSEASGCNSLISPLVRDSSSSASKGEIPPEPKAEKGMILPPLNKSEEDAAKKRKLEEVDGVTGGDESNKKKTMDGEAVKEADKESAPPTGDEALMISLKQSVRAQLEYEQTKLGPEGSNAGVLTRLRQLTYLLNYFTQQETGNRSGNIPLPLPPPPAMTHKESNEEMAKQAFLQAGGGGLPPQLTAQLQAQLQAQLHAQLQTLDNIPPQLQAQLHALQQAQLLAVHSGLPSDPEQQRMFFAQQAAHQMPAHMLQQAQQAHMLMQQKELFDPIPMMNMEPKQLIHHGLVGEEPKESAVVAEVGARVSAEMEGVGGVGNEMDGGAAMIPCPQFPSLSIPGTGMEGMNPMNSMNPLPPAISVEVNAGVEVSLEVPSEVPSEVQPEVQPEFQPEVQPEVQSEIPSEIPSGAEEGGDTVEIPIINGTEDGLVEGGEGAIALNLNPATTNEEEAAI